MWEPSGSGLTSQVASYYKSDASISGLRRLAHISLIGEFDARYLRNRCRSSYDFGSGVGWLEVISSLDLATTRLQRLPEQKKRPSTQASTRSEFAPFIAIVA